MRIDPDGDGQLPVVVRNESSTDVYFGAGSAKVIVHPGVVQTISDAEWATVATSKRGPGQIRCLWPVEADSIETRTLIDYYSTASTNQVRYIGQGTQDAATSALVWTIKRYAHVDLGGGDVFISDVQVLVNVAWDDRATLGWT